MRHGVGVLVIMGVLSACSFEHVKNQSQPADLSTLEIVGFDRVRADVIEPGQCLECHSPPDPARGVRLDNLPAILAKPNLVVASRAEDSQLYQAVSSGWMPLERAPLPADRISILKRWIDEGAHAESVRRSP
ncbi:MAG: c-type cytochrome domain-containing protein [Bdellovibrionales bacterium]